MDLVAFPKQPFVAGITFEEATVSVISRATKELIDILWRGAGVSIVLVFRKFVSIQSCLGDHMLRKLPFRGHFSFCIGKCRPILDAGERH